MLEDHYVASQVGRGFASGEVDERFSMEYENVTDILPDDLGRLVRAGDTITSVAMELTDAWGGAMFLLEPEFVSTVFRTAGFSDDVAASVYETLQEIPYVEHRRAGEITVEPVTWHKMDATCLALRGAGKLRAAMAPIDDTVAEQLLTANRDTFDALMAIMPDFTRNLMFAPEVGARVLGTFGAKVTADGLYDLSWCYAGQATRDLEGRRGIPTQFIRSLSMVISSRL